MQHALRLITTFNYSLLKRFFAHIGLFIQLALTQNSTDTYFIYLNDARVSNNKVSMTAQMSISYEIRNIASARNLINITLI